MTVFIIGGILAGTASVFLLCHEWLVIRERKRNKLKARKRLDPLGKAVSTRGEATGLLSKMPLNVWRKRREGERLMSSYERDLPALLEVIALGMQAGMGFDQAFALYAQRFGTPLAKCCEESLAVWQKGLISREEGMRQLAERVATQSFKHFCSSALRALRFGAPMTQLLLDLAREARKEYRAKRQEIVAKAPVKMLLPTGALILPAMLLLVMGPILLDLLRKMG